MVSVPKKKPNISFLARRVVTHNDTCKYKSKHDNSTRKRIKVRGWPGLVAGCALVAGAVGIYAGAQTALAENVVKFSLVADSSLDVTVPSSVALAINPTTDGKFGSTDIAVTTSTNYENGYTLIMSPKDGVTALTGSNATGDDDPYTIPTFATGVSYSATDFASSTTNTNTLNRWAYKKSTDTNYTGVLAEQEILKTEDKNGGVAISTTLNVGAKLDNTVPSGNYSVDLIFSATPNPVLYSINYVANANSDSSLANMPSPNPQGGIAEMTGSTSIELNNSTPTRTNYNFLGWCDGTTTTTSGVDSCSGTTYAPGATYTMDTSTVLEANLLAMWSVKRPGVSFVFNTGVASVTVNGTTIRSTDSTKTVNLNAGQTYTLTVTPTTGYTSGSATLTTAGGGSLSGLQFTVGSETALITLSASPRTDIQLAVTLDTAQVSKVEVRESSQSGTLKGTITTSGGSVNNLDFSKTYYLVPTLKNTTDYKFSATAWTNASGLTIGSATSSTTSVTFTAVSASVKLNTEANAVYIQDFTKAMCQTQASSAPVTVTDKRDDNEYTVRYINGNCWMTQNLRFTETSLDPSTTNVTSAKTITWKNLKNDSVCKGTSLDANNSTNLCMKVPDSTDLGALTNCKTDNNNTTCTAEQVGVWYNYAAATAGTITGTSNSTAASQDICPAGWRLPTGNTGGEQGGITSSKDAFAPIYSGYYNNGSLGSVAYGVWWSATSYNTTDRYFLYYSNGALNTSRNNRCVGYSVRCVRSS